MPRRGTIVRHQPLPDPRYNSVVVTQFMNKIMERGKKSVAQRLFYDAMDQIEARTGKPGVQTFEQALRNATPMIEVKPRRVGGSTYQVPVEIRPDRRISVGMKWLILYARKRAGKGMANKLAAEIMAAAKGEGAAVKKREDTHKMAESNRAFAHFVR